MTAPTDEELQAAELELEEGRPVALRLAVALLRRASAKFLDPRAFEELEREARQHPDTLALFRWVRPRNVDSWVRAPEGGIHLLRSRS